MRLMLFLPSAGRLPYLLLPPTSLWAVQGQEPLSPAPHSATTTPSWQRPALRSPPAPCWSLDPESHGHLPGPHALSDQPCPCLQCLGLPPLPSLNSLALLPLTPSPSPAPFPRPSHAPPPRAWLCLASVTSSLVIVAQPHISAPRPAPPSHRNGLSLPFTWLLQLASRPPLQYHLLL